MNYDSMQSIEPTTDSGASRALDEFFAMIRTASRESSAAVANAKPALARIAPAITGQDSGQAQRVRSILVSLYTGGTVLADVSELMALDWSLRRDVCAVLLAFGHGEFGYDYMRSAFEEAGDYNAQWFLSAAPEPDERLREALAFAKPGPLDLTPRTLTEKGMATLLLSVFAGVPVELDQALKCFDQQRAGLVTDIVSNYLAGRFDSHAAEMARTFFVAA